MSAPAVPSPSGLPGKLTSQSYILPPSLTYEQWESAGWALQAMHSGIQFWIGDWLLYGERRFDQQAYQAVQDQMGRGDNSLRQAVWVAERFEPKRRQPALTWTHHRLCAHLDEPQRYEILRQAASHEPPWTTRELQEHLNGLNAIEGETVEATSEPGVDDVADLDEQEVEEMLAAADRYRPQDRRSFAQGFVAGRRCYARNAEGN